MRALAIIFAVAVVWAADGVHKCGIITGMWSGQRRGCAAELERAAGAGEADGNAIAISPKHGLSADQRGASSGPSRRPELDCAKHRTLSALEMLRSDGE